jgi:tellurite resistance protein
MDSMTDLQARFSKMDTLFLKYLLPDQADAVVEALVVAALGDGVIDPVELSQLEEQFQLLWPDPSSAARRAQAVSRAMTVVKAALEDPDQAITLVESIAERLSGTALRESVYGLCCAVAWGDGAVQSGERNVLGGLRCVLGISEERSVELLAAARNG